MRLSARRYRRLPKRATPPDLSVAEAALLVFGEVGPAATGGTILELAQLGAVRIDEGPVEHSAQTVVLVDPGAAVEEHHRVLLKGMFPLLKPGDSRMLRRGRKDNVRMLGAHDKLGRAVEARVSEADWYYRTPVPGRAGRLLRRTRLLGWGILTPAGHAMVDQVLGFRRYVATLEPGEIRQAELIRLLPWALMLGLHHRWEQLAAGLPVDDDEPVSWWSATGMFRLGPFRRGLAAFDAAATDRAARDTKYYYGLYDYGPGDNDGFFDSGPSGGSGFDASGGGDNNW
ncbi:hypothetical protein AB0H36_35295 [Kribbella sp. NPDC050820]|uniref:hypothetical protein n=1 Tax=Kribbella sp. NPDC050820 TaxID=3155408 RepID=UPI0033D434BF